MLGHRGPPTHPPHAPPSSPFGGEILRGDVSYSFAMAGPGVRTPGLHTHTHPSPFGCELLCGDVSFFFSMVRPGVRAPRALCLCMISSYSAFSEFLLAIYYVCF